MMEESFVGISGNPLLTRGDMEKAVIDLLNPLKKFYSSGGAQLHLGNTGTVYPELCAEMEGFARPLWALAPFWAGGGQSELSQMYLKGIRNGTNPEHEEYWGDIGNLDQRMVEMAALSLAIAIAPDKVWDPLSQQEKENFQSWLLRINNYRVSDNNWLFFQVLVNMALKKVGATFNQEKLDRALKRLDDFYLSEGWYSDGPTEQRDYYIAFAMHYYGLLYSKFMEKEDPERSKLYKERAGQFAKEFIYWFASDGSALPYGRSLTYRFAQCAFWSAMVFAGVEAFSLGVMKGIILRNLRWWFRQPIFERDGILTIGYGYPNLIMAEGYNAPGSPYWSLKAFLLLALKESHPFWQIQEEDLPSLERLKVLQHPHMVICRNEKGRHILAYTSGQKANHVHSAAKYEKFVYSNIFAFSVPKGEFGLAEGAYDSMLALSENDDLYRVRRGCEEFKIVNNILYSRWKPWRDVQVETWILPGNPWHVRIHCIDTQRPLRTAESGFSIKREEPGFMVSARNIIQEQNNLLILFPWGASGVLNLYGERRTELIIPEANTNLMYPRTCIPTMTGVIGTGKYWLVSAIFGGSADQVFEKLWENRPQFSMQDHQIVIKFEDNGELNSYVVPISING